MKSAHSGLRAGGPLRGTSKQNNWGAPLLMPFEKWPPMRVADKRFRHLKRRESGSLECVVSVIAWLRQRLMEAATLVPGLNRHIHPHDLWKIDVQLFDEFLRLEDVADISEEKFVLAFELRMLFTRIAISQLNGYAGSPGKCPSTFTTFMPGLTSSELTNATAPGKAARASFCIPLENSATGSARTSPRNT